MPEPKDHPSRPPNPFAPTDEEIDTALNLAAALVNLTMQPGWKQWEETLKAKREQALENLSLATPDSVKWLQGYATALKHVLDVPTDYAVYAKEAQRQREEETGDVDDAVRVGPHHRYGDGELAI